MHLRKRRHAVTLPTPVGVEGIVSASSETQAAAVPADPEHLRHCWSKRTLNISLAEHSKRVGQGEMVEGRRAGSSTRKIKLD